MPERLWLDEHRSAVLDAVLVVASPEEGCALLLGRRQGSVLRLEAVWPCLNVWQPEAERERRFAIDPREQLHAQVWARSRGWQVLGSAHSHPGGPPVPSATDRSLCFAPTLMVILGGSRVPGPEPWLDPGDLGCWWLAETGPPLALPWTMED